MINKKYRRTIHVNARPDEHVWIHRSRPSRSVPASYKSQEPVRPNRRRAQAPRPPVYTYPLRSARPDLDNLFGIPIRVWKVLGVILGVVVLGWLFIFILPYLIVGGLICGVLHFWSKH